ncbi:MAG TPA: hypothetical protein VJT78_05110 [Candidatus Dormibacteraeota bacterium]|nr:hypothetical protein [Candidatus Dormibacteraeota bacterium]
MDAYSTANWGAVFSAITGATAALTGLLFVALSINLSQVIKGPGLIPRAVEVLVLLVSALLISTLLLMPGQPPESAAIEIISIAVTEVILLGIIQARAPRRVMGVSTANFAGRVAGAHSGPLLLLVGGATMLLHGGGGLYWVVPGLLAAMVAAIIGAWVMLVEIVR